METSISINELKEIINEPNVLVLDVRKPSEYNEGHVPHAKNIPVEDLGKRISELPADKLIVTTCGRGGGRARRAFTLLQEKGIQSKWLDGGSLGYLDTL
jgi:rhodanese-related sulfurtransferase